MMNKNITDLLLEEYELLNEIKELQSKAITEKQKQEENEAGLWLNTPFKEKQLTNDRQRKAYVTQQMALLYPSFYELYKTQITQKESQIQWIRETIKVMMFLGIEEVQLGDNDEPKDTNKRDGTSTTLSSS